MTAITKAVAGALGLRGTLSATAWEPPVGGISTAEWQQTMSALATMESGVSWWVGDCWVYGVAEHRAGREFVESNAWSGPAYETCTNLGSVCSRSRRRDLVPFTHHAEIVGLPEDQQEELLDWIEETVAETGNHALGVSYATASVR